MAQHIAALVACMWAGSLVYCALVLIAVHGYLRQRRKPGGGEAISVLKPLSGADEDLEANLRSFFEQDYRQFEIIGAVREESDGAAAVFRRLACEYSHIPARLIVTGEPPYPNAKVFSLSRMLAEARHDLVLMSDSDVRIKPGTLEKVAAEFENPETALASCPYRAIAGDSIWSELEAAGMNTEFTAGLLVARMLMGVDFAIGPTIAARRQALDAVGFGRLSEYLAEDFVLGKFAAKAGLGVILSSVTVEHRIGSEDLRANFSHRLRWARSTRRSRPFGYIGQVFTYPLPVALALAALWPHGWLVLIPAILCRALAAWAVSRLVLEAPVGWALLPLQDLLSFAVWLAGFFGNTITWRGRRYYLHPDGRFEPWEARLRAPGRASPAVLPRELP